MGIDEYGGDRRNLSGTRSKVVALPVTIIITAVLLLFPLPWERARLCDVGITLVFTGWQQSFVWQATRLGEATTARQQGQHVAPALTAVHVRPTTATLSSFKYSSRGHDRKAGPLRPVRASLLFMIHVRAMVRRMRPRPSCRRSFPLKPPSLPSRPSAVDPCIISLPIYLLCHLPYSLIPDLKVSRADASLHHPSASSPLRLPRGGRGSRG